MNVFYKRLSKYNYLINLKFFYTVIIILAIYTINAVSQTRVDSLEYLGRILPTSFLNSQFDKQLNTFYLISRFQLFKETDDFYFRINENFASTFIRSANRNTRDEQHLSLVSKYKLNKTIFLGVLANSSLLSDNRSLGINESAVNYVTMFSELKPVDNIVVSPFGGYSNNKQIGITDNGFVYGIEGLLSDLTLSDLEINSELRYKNEDILPRRNLLRSFGLSVVNNFQKGVSNRIRTGYNQSRKDFYFNADPSLAQEFDIDKNLQSRTETAYFLQDRLFYDNFLENFSLDFGGGLNWRRIDRDTRFRSLAQITPTSYDTKIDELKLEAEAITRYISRTINFTLRANYYERDEKNSPKRFDGVPENIYEQQIEREALKNNNSTRATLTLAGNLRFSDNDFLSFSMYQSKLQYDTPSNLNDDDRDEILSIIRLGYLSRLSAYFSAFVALEGTYGHTVYLFASRSSNNNKNRILRLRAGGDYYSSFVRSSNSFEVLANYTVYDFEDLTSNNHSYSFRQFTAIDSTTIKLVDNVSLFNYAYIKLSEIGDFRWDSFTARPTRFLKEIYLEPRFILEIERSVFSAGLRFFLLGTYGYEKEIKILQSDFVSIGPIALIDILVFKRLNLIFKGYYEFVSGMETPDTEQANLTMNIYWKF